MSDLRRQTIKKLLLIILLIPTLAHAEATATLSIGATIINFKTMTVEQVIRMCKEYPQLKDKCDAYFATLPSEGVYR